MGSTRKPKRPAAADLLPERAGKTSDEPASSVKRSRRVDGTSFFAAGMLFRMQEEGNRWRMCSSTQVGHAADSKIHRYRREIGFHNLASEKARSDQVIADAEDLIAAEGIGDMKSHAQRVMRFAQFERYCQEL
jgi:hypothetical protein